MSSCIENNTVKCERNHPNELYQYLQTAVTSAQSYIGRTVTWFKDTSSGRFALTILNATGAVVFGVLHLALIVSAVCMVLLAVKATVMGVGIPIGLLALGISVAFGASAYFSRKLALYFKDNAEFHYEKMKSLAVEEKARSKTT